MRALPDRRLRSHLLTTPAASVGEASAHMLATQAQEFWGGRWALALRTSGRPTLRDVDAAFDRGEIVRSWTMRGTIHIVSARDLTWLLALTGDRQRRAFAATHRREGIDAEELHRAERAALGALAGGGRLTRAELFAVLDGAGVVTSGQRGYHVLCALSWRGLICQGPVVPRVGGPTREQYVVRTDEWITEAAAPASPLAELFARYIGSHGPAGARDFAWWSGLPLGVARDAAAAASDRLSVVAGEGEPVYVTAGAMPRRPPRMPEVLALPPFDEYYLSYAARTLVCAPELLRRVGPGVNGMVRPILVARGEVVGAWSHSHAVGRHEGDPLPELFVSGAASPEEVDAALQRYSRFLLG